MAEQPWPPTERELERALIDLGARIAYPPTPPLAQAVRERLLAEVGQSGPSASPRRPRGIPPRGIPVAGPYRRLRRRLALALLALAVAVGAGLAASPAARAALADWLRLHGITIVYLPGPPSKPPAPLGTHLQLGSRTTLAAAQLRVPYRIAVPAGLGRPDEVYVGATMGNTEVSLVYRARAGLPPVGKTRIGLLLTEAAGNPRVEGTFAFKGLPPGSRLEVVSIGGAPAYWITGQPHYVFQTGVFYTGADGRVVEDTVRLAGNTLLWQRGRLTLRLESGLSRAAALRIAASVR